ncbi:EAL domain-containing protein [Actimicrobium sp. CCI2.3]|uniref:EAL domain-containing protein n=1 Tax=Actimicrobium sp. CCI2.3 TaxID=3048616 RepID=UPI002AB389B8|nr:EAL domain-containing protein [Actimicrobium sp. CCI2.3]MDY7576700.1 EAL domain-containing protein [Actimicrobium sp. CCI2.3]MEB0023574.1 EAL domain-containing protein [Actimicrobium sp. CCI2.3]
MKTILIVDDRIINLEFLATLLDYGGYRVQRAVHGAQALKMALLQPPDLVISDILMPVMDGIELVNRLHANPVTAQIPVIFYTATYSVGQAEAMAQTFGVTAVLTKPAEPQKILETVALALGNVFVLPSETDPSDTHDLTIMPELTGLQQRLQQALSADIDVDATPDMPSHPMYALANVQTLSLRLAALLELSMTLSTERDSQCLLERFCRTAQNIMGTTRSAVCMHGRGQPRRSANCDMAGGDIDQIFEALDAYTADAGVMRERLAGGCMLDLGGVAAEVRHLPWYHPLRHSFLMVPIMQGAEQQGWLYLSGKTGAIDFSDEDKEFGTILAAQLAPLYENLNLYEAVQQHVGLLEREVVERKLVADKLKLSEAGLRRAQILTKSAHIVSANDGRFESWSKTLPQLIGVAEHAMPTTIEAWLALVEIADRAKFLACYRTAGISTTRMQVGYRVRHSDGTTIELHQVLEPFPECADAIGKRLFHTLQDVTLQKDQERRVARLNRVAVILSGINSAIVRIHDRNALFQEACRVAVNQGAFGMAWVGIIDPTTQKGKVVASFGGKDEHAAPFSARANTVDSDLPWSVAVRELRPVFCNDIDTLLPTTGAMQKHGYRSLAAIPLMLDQQAVAVFTLLSDEVGNFNEQEQKLLNEMAGDLSFGLRFIDKEEKLSYLACYDVLTGLPNRMLFHDRLTQFLQGVRHDNSITPCTCVILLDLDHFSQLNDVLGRHAGDAVLLQVAERISATLTEPYSLARISGDIFAIAVPNLQVSTDLTSILEQQIFSAFNSAFTVDLQEVRMTARAGLALYPDDGRDAETLFKHAEIALKKAKSLDERYLYYAPQMNAALAARLKLRSELQEALDLGQFVVFYQPRVDLQSGCIVSAEALIRWQHPQSGTVPPDHFIPLAEETGLIVPIGAWVIDTVCAQQSAWLAQQVVIVPVAVNLSAAQFKKGQVLHTIRDSIARHGLASKYIEFELTESIVMSDPEVAARDLQALKQLHVKLALDDFGTGYSSLAYLKRFPFDFLKIDRAFITDITKSSKDAMIAIAVIAMGHSLGLRVVAEGVETEEQLDCLRRHGCDEIQGYYFSRPVPAADFEAMLREDKRLPPSSVSAEPGAATQPP